MTNLDVSIRAKFLNQFGPGAKAAEKDLAAVKRAANDLGKGQTTEKLSTGLAKADTKARATKRAVAELKRETDRLGQTRSSDRVAKDIGEIGRAARSSQRDVSALARELAKTRAGGVGRAGATPEKARVGGRGLGVGEIGPGAGAAVGMLGMRAVAPFGAAYLAKKTFDQAVDWDSAWAEVKKKVNDADEPKFETLEKTVRRLSFELGVGRVELAGLVAEAGAAGIAYGDLERFMVLTGKAAVGWDMTPREASEKLAYTKAAMGYTIDQMDVLANKINALGDNSAAKESDILEMFLRVGAAAREAGVDTDSTLAILTGVRSGGMQPEVVSRWFGALTGGLRTAEQQPKRVQKGLEMLGLTAKGVARGMKTDGVATLLDLFERLEKSPKAVEAATSIFGREWWDETMRAKGGLAEIRKQLAFIHDPKNYQGSLEKTFGVQAGTARNHVAKFQEIVSRVGESLASWTLAPFNAGIDAAIAKMADLQSRASWWSRWSAEEEARLKARGDLQPPGGDVQGRPPPGQDAAPEWIKRIRRGVYGDDRTADVVIGEWLFGKPGQKDAQTKAAEEAGWEAAQAEKRGRIRAMIDQRQRLEKMIGNPAFPDQEGMITRASAIDENLRKALGSAELGPVARAVMEAYVQALTTEGEKAPAEARRIAEELAQILSITARPSIDVALPLPRDAATARDQSEKRARIRSMLDERRRLETTIEHPAARDRKRLKAQASAIDENLRQALGSAELGPVARQEMEAYVQALTGEGQKATAEARRIASELTRILSITARPTVAAPPPSRNSVEAGDQTERRNRIRSMLEERQRLEKMIENPAVPNHDGLKAQASAIDENLRQALGSAELGPVARQEMEAFVQALTAEGQKATAEAQRIAAELMRILSITARPTIEVTKPQAVPGGAGTGTPAAPSPSASGKQSNVIHQYIYSSDPGRAARLAQREQDRAIRSARAGALHDIGSWA